MAAGGVGSHTPGPGAGNCGNGPDWEPSPNRAASVPHPAASPTALPSARLGPSAMAASCSASAASNVAALAGRNPVSTRCPATAAAAVAEAPGGAVTSVKRGSPRPSTATTASYMATCIAATTNGWVVSGRPEGVSTSIAIWFQRHTTEPSAVGGAEESVEAVVCSFALADGAKMANASVAAAIERRARFMTAPLLCFACE